jgi:hypothetical protein
MKSPPNNTGKVLTRYVHAAGGTALTLNLRPAEAASLRSLVASIRLRGDKTPSLSLIARRAVTAYIAHIQYSPETRASEIAVLERLATPFTDRATTKAPPA